MPLRVAGMSEEVKITENTPNRLRIVTFGIAPYCIVFLCILGLLWSHFVGISMVRLTLDKPPGPVVLSSQESRSDPMIYVEHCSMAGQSQWLRSILPSFLTCSRHLIRLTDLAQVSIERVPHKNRKGKITHHTRNLILHTKPTPSTPYPAWIKAKGYTFIQRQDLTYFEFSERQLDTALELKHKLSSILAVFSSNPHSELWLHHEDNSTFLHEIVSILSFTLLIWAAWKLDASEELVFDRRLGQLFIRISGPCGLRARVQVISLQDILSVDEYTRKASKDRIRYGIRLICLPTLETGLDAILDERARRTGARNLGASVADNAPAQADAAEANPANDDGEANVANAANAANAGDADDAGDAGGAGDADNAGDIANAAGAANDAEAANQNPQPAMLGNPALADLFKEDGGNTPGIETKNLLLGCTLAERKVIANVLATIHSWLQQYYQSTALAAVNNSAQSSSEVQVSPTENGRRCAICLDDTKPPNILFLPCRHLISCDSCFTSLRKCPLCNAPIRSTMQVYA